LGEIVKGASPGKVKWINLLFEKIIHIINRQECELLNAEAKLNGFYDRKDYLTEMAKYMDILILLGASDVPIKAFRFDILRWMCENNEEQKRPYTFYELFYTHKMIGIYEALEGEMPKSLSQLKDYIKDIQSND
jgi:hypothetical protein